MIPASAKDFALLQSVQTPLWAKPALLSVNIGDVFLEGKEARREADHSLPSSAGFKSEWSYTSDFLYAFVSRVRSPLTIE